MVLGLIEIEAYQRIIYEQRSSPSQIDALLPKEMAVKAENAGIAKAGLDEYKMFVMAILAGAFIAMGANYATTVWAGLAGAGCLMEFSGSWAVWFLPPVLSWWS